MHVYVPSRAAHVQPTGTHTVQPAVTCKKRRAPVACTLALGACPSVTSKKDARTDMHAGAHIHVYAGTGGVADPAAMAAAQEREKTVRSLLHKDPTAALRKALEAPPVATRDRSVKVSYVCVCVSVRLRG